MMDPIQQSLSRLFDRHRVVLWYDPASSWKTESEGVELDGVELVRVDNNELNLKFRLLRDEPESKFLLYFPTGRPADEENWLLDILLANAEFHADKASMHLQGMGLPPEFKDLVQQHQAFFSRKERREALASRVESDDTHRQIIARNFLFHPLGSIPAEGPGSEGVRCSCCVRTRTRRCRNKG